MRTRGDSWQTKVSKSLFLGGFFVAKIVNEVVKSIRNLTLLLLATHDAVGAEFDDLIGRQFKAENG